MAKREDPIGAETIRFDVDAATGRIKGAFWVKGEGTFEPIRWGRYVTEAPECIVLKSMKSKKNPRCPVYPTPFGQVQYCPPPEK